MNKQKAENATRVAGGEEVMEADKEAYLEWKAELARRGMLPKDAVSLYKEQGMAQYAEELDAVIQRMEGIFEAPI